MCPYSISEETLPVLIVCLPLCLLSRMFMVAACSWHTRMYFLHLPAWFADPGRCLVNYGDGRSGVWAWSPAQTHSVRGFFFVDKVLCLGPSLRYNV